MKNMLSITAFLLTYAIIGYVIGDMAWITIASDPIERIGTVVGVACCLLIGALPKI